MLVLGRWLQYLLLLMAAAVSRGSEQHSLCTKDCCQVLPNCTAATRLQCECPDQSKITVGKGDIPPTVQAIVISGASRVNIQENAIYDLPSLTFLRFKDIGNMEVQPDGLKIQPGARIFSINVKNVGSLELQSSAFSGSWNSDVKIRMQNVARLHIRAEAFSFNSTTHGPHVSLEQINLLNLAPHGFSSPISQITVMHAHMATCDTASFGNNFDKVELKNVTIDEAKSGCAHVAGSKKSLSFHSCQVDIVQSLAFTGRMYQMILEDSNLTIVHGNGFQIDVGDLQITNSRFRDLGSNALNVTAKHAISLTRINVEMLKRNALTGLHVEPGKNHEALIIRSLHVLHAEDGSLKLSKRCNLRLYDLSVDPPNPPVCPIAMWARHLTGQEGTETLTRNGDMVFKQINRQKLCQPTQTVITPNKSTDRQRRGEMSPEVRAESNVGTSTLAPPRTTEALDDRRPLDNVKPAITKTEVSDDRQPSDNVEPTTNSKHVVTDTSFSVIKHYDSVKNSPENAKNAGVTELTLIVYVVLGVALMLFVFGLSFLVWWWRKDRKAPSTNGSLIVNSAYEGSDHVRNSNPAHPANCVSIDARHTRRDLPLVPSPPNEVTGDRDLTYHLYEEIEDDQGGSGRGASAVSGRVAGARGEHVMLLVAEGDSVPRRRHVPRRQDQAAQRRSASPERVQTPVETKCIEEIFNKWD